MNLTRNSHYGDWRFIWSLRQQVTHSLSCDAPFSAARLARHAAAQIEKYDNPARRRAVSSVHYGRRFAVQEYSEILSRQITNGNSMVVSDTEY